MHAQARMRIYARFSLEISFRPKKTKDGLQTKGVTDVYVRSDGLNSQLGVIFGAEAIGGGMGTEKAL
jgi:hypothetical protein